jgi:hypothetical protein
VLTDSRVTVDLHAQRVSHEPFAPTTDHSVFTPDRVEIRQADGTLVESLDRPALRSLGSNSKHRGRIRNWRTSRATRCGRI